MTQQRRSSLDRLAIILYRKMRGDSISSIADDYHLTKTRIYVLLQQARSNLDVKREAELMNQSSEKQMSFDFGI